MKFWLALLAAVSNALPSEEILRQEFAAFVAQFGKSYQPNTAEWEARFVHFVSSYAEYETLKEEMEKLPVDDRIDVGFSFDMDLSPEEKQIMFAPRPVSAHGLDGAAEEEEIYDFDPEDAGYPDFLDYTQGFYLSAAKGGNARALLHQFKDQYSRKDGKYLGPAVGSPRSQPECGSCWAHSSAGAVEGAVALARMKQYASDSAGKSVMMPTFLTNPATQHLIDCEHYAAGCDGATDMTKPLLFAQKTGLCPTRTYPYMDAEGRCQGARACSAEERIHIGQSYDISFTSASKLMDTLYKHGPVVVSVAAESNPAMRKYKGGILTRTNCRQSQLDHAVLAVGWDYRLLSNGRKQYYFIVRNSWGKNWGVQGNFRITYLKDKIGF